MMETASGAFRLSSRSSTELIIVAILLRYADRTSHILSCIALTTSDFSITLQLDIGNSKNILEELSHVTAAPRGSDSVTSSSRTLVFSLQPLNSVVQPTRGAMQCKLESGQ